MHSLCIELRITQLHKNMECRATILLCQIHVAGLNVKCRIPQSNERMFVCAWFSLDANLQIPNFINILPVGSDCFYAHRQTFAVLRTPIKLFDENEL